MSDWLPPPTAATLIPPNRSHPFFDFAASHPLERESADWSLANAAWFADLSLLAYDDPDEVAAALAPAGFDLAGTQPLTAEPRGAAQAYVAHDDDDVLVVFRGSEIPYATSTRGYVAKSMDALVDTLANLRVGLEPFDELGRAHAGFAGALDEVWPRLEGEWLSPLARGARPRRVWFTGHSLGAATAALAALRFGRPAALYTFGSPRIGDDALARAAATLPAWRVVLRRDLVTRVPPSSSRGLAWIPDGYRHLGELRHVDATGDVHPTPPEPEEPPDGLIDAVAAVSSPLDAVRGAMAGVRSFTDALISGEASRDTRRFVGALHDHAPLWYALTLRHLAGVETAGGD